MLDPPPSEEWFVSEGGKLSGPYPVARIEDLVRWGKLSKRAYLCDAHGGLWVPVGKSAFAALFEDKHHSGHECDVATRMNVRSALPATERGLTPFGLFVTMFAIGAAVIVALHG